MGMYGGSTTIQAPAAPKYGESMRDILKAQVEMAPQVFASESLYQPKYQQLQAQIQAQSAQDQMALLQKMQPAYSQLEDAYTRAQQQNQLKGLQEVAPGYIKSFQEAQGTAGINQALRGYAESNLGSQLQAGFKMSPEEQRALEQNTLQGYAGRGTALGSQAGLANVLNRYNYVQGRQQQALQQASGIGSYLAQQSQPALASFYQQPMYAQTAGGNTIQQALMSQGQAGPALFNPESQTGMGSIYGAYNTQVGLASAQAQANAGKKAGMMSMVGSLGGAAIGALAMCWVAREVYGEHNPAWMRFRKWMLSDAPRWLVGLYVAFGEQIANFIADKPKLKNVIRKWMDSKITA